MKITIDITEEEEKWARFCEANEECGVCPYAISEIACGFMGRIGKALSEQKECPDCEGRKEVNGNCGECKAEAQCYGEGWQCIYPVHCPTCQGGGVKK